MKRLDPQANFNTATAPAGGFGTFTPFRPKTDYKPPAPAGIGAWLLYTELHSSNNLPTDTRHHIQSFDGENTSLIERDFDGFLKNQGLTVHGLMGDKAPLYNLHDFMKANAPVSHRICDCLEHRVRAKDGKGKELGVSIVIDENDNVEVTNIARCGHAFEPFCNHHDGSFLEQQARQVQKTHLDNGGDCLQATFTAWRGDMPLKPFRLKLQKAYSEFDKLSKTIFASIGLVGSLKRNEYAYSFLYRHHQHIHNAYAIAPISDEKLELIAEQLNSLWHTALTNNGLTPTAKAFDIRKSDNAFGYVGKKHKSNLSLDDLENIQSKETVTIFELAFLAMVGLFPVDDFAQVYAEVLDCYKGVSMLRYSKKFFDKLGLIEYESPKPKKQRSSEPRPAPATLAPMPETPPMCNDKGQYGFDFSPPTDEVGQFSLFDDIMPQKPPKKERSDKGKPRKTKPPPKPQNYLFTDGLKKIGYIYRPRPKKRKVVTRLHWYRWQALKQNNEHLVYFGLVKNGVKKGYIKLE